MACGESVRIPVVCVFESARIALLEGTWGTSFNPGTISGPCGSSRPCVPEDGPYEDMDDFLGDEGTGTWTLMIDDTFVPYPGNLDYWRIKLTCEASGDESTS